MGALMKFGYDRIYTEKASGGKDDRPELAKALEMLREGDTFIVYKPVYSSHVECYALIVRVKNKQRGSRICKRFSDSHLL